jgi:hypothetical protein
VIRTLAAIKVTVGLLCIGHLFSISAFGSPESIYLLHVVAFTSAAGILYTRQRSDKRATDLATIFILAAACFAEPLMSRSQSPGFRAFLNVFLAAEPEAFLAYFVSEFVSKFPRRGSLAFGQGRATWMTSASLMVGIILFLANTIPILLPTAALNPIETLLLEPDEGVGGYFWTLQMLLIIPGAVSALWKTRRAETVERRRVRLFVWGFLLGAAPILLTLIADSAVPGFVEFMKIPRNRLLGAFIIYPALLSIPLTTAYAVMVHRVLDVRLIVRSAIQYTLARYSVIAISAIPFLFLIGYAYQHRQEPLDTLVAGSRVIALIAAVSIGTLIYRHRQQALRAIDRRFFREQYDAHRILTELVSNARQASGLDQMIEALSTELDRALHLESVDILLLEQERSEFRSLKASFPPLPRTRSLAEIVEAGTQPLDLDEDDRHSLFNQLSIEDREWVIETRCRTLVPIPGSDRMTIGLIVLGPKKSELPLSAEDRTLLAAIAASAGFGIESRMHSPTTAATTKDETASCCESCMRVFPSVTLGQLCKQCGGSMSSLNVPHILFGKFRIERKIGAGGMGVVYQAHDASLDRRVAIKTLPRVSAESALRLRKEARAMAAVTHPNLAIIFGAEAWRGIPLLIFEYLDGTLSDRLSRGPLAPRDVIKLGIDLCKALDCVHAAGILHRDIKPSNIGFGRDSAPKLMDFGLARLVLDALPESHAAFGTTLSGDAKTAAAAETIPATSAARLIGTPAYLSPETARGEEPDVRCDLWALALTLYEALTARNPIQQRDIMQTLAYARMARVPDVREFQPQHSDKLAFFFSDALAKDRLRRPSTALEMRKRMEALANVI